jgi:hypothetical protein
VEVGRAGALTPFRALSDVIVPPGFPGERRQDSTSG